MTEELKELIENTSNREALAVLFDRLADRLDAMRAELFPKKAEAAAAKGGVAHDG